MAEQPKRDLAEPLFDARDPDPPLQRFAVWYIPQWKGGQPETPKLDRLLVRTFKHRENAEAYIAGKEHLLIEDILATALRGPDRRRRRPG